MPFSNRRVFMIRVAATGAALASQGPALAQTERVSETDAYPKSMGFRVDTKTVDQVKFPRHEASQKCSTCQLYSRKEGDELGTCSFFKRLVPAEGWCRNFKPKKAA